MIAMTFEMPGLERIRGRFVDLLTERKTSIAQHALDAWDASTAFDIITNLEKARGILHQIAGTAGTVGYPTLGETAHQCEARIIAHLESPAADVPECPSEIILHIEGFVKACDTLSEVPPT